MISTMSISMNCQKPFMHRAGRCECELQNCLCLQNHLPSAEWWESGCSNAK